MRPLVDAHNHLQDTALAPQSDILASMTEVGIGYSLVNGTSESDWPKVADLATRFPDHIQPSFGVHPWYAAERSARWLDTLADLLHTHPRAGVGECGLDRWMRNHDLEDQQNTLLSQIQLAATLNRPLTLHCLRAWGPLLTVLQSTPLPERGFLLHAFSGPQELVTSFVDLGAYFSFSGYFLHERKARTRETFRSIPLDRLLIETDAPAMPLPPSLRSHQLPMETQKTLNHPANLPVTFLHLSKLLDCAPENLREILHSNEQLFLGSSK